jgi:MutS domain V
MSRAFTAVQEYQARLNARCANRDALTAADARLAYARLATFFSGVVLAVLAWHPGVPIWWLLAPGAVFVWLVRRHDGVLRARELAIRGIGFYERGLARLEDRWPGTGEPGERFRDDRHVYANDLDLFGRGSLFELLSLARTRTGEAMLAGWLTAAADPPEIQARQAAVEEFASALDLREQLALAGADRTVSVNTERLVHWAEAPMPSLPTLRGVTWFFTTGILFASLYLAVTSVWWPLSAVLVMHTVALLRFRGEMNTILSTREPGIAADFVADVLTHRSRDLDAVADLLTLLERARFEGSRLVLLHSRLTGAGLPASRIIRRLHRLSEILEWHKNTAALPLGLFLYGAYTGQNGMLALALIVSGVLLLVRPHVALAVERWRSRYGHRVRIWVETIAQFEAFSSLAAYRYEHEDDPFPEIVAGDAGTRAGALFEAVQLGHPLLPRATMVRNDVRLAAESRLLVVSGSNMSGKSTLLRTVGINVVMALAGAPVRAVSLRLSPLAVGATLRIQDSLLEGRSRFYAEITRIRTLADIAAGPVPLLFLLDELFHGTNSHDRLLGAQGVLASLLDRGAIGLITTHDLALTAIAEELAPRALNVHFEDWFEGGAIRFDYRMKPGPVTRSNALALMRAVGLEVASSTEGLHFPKSRGNQVPTGSYRAHESE